MNEDRNSSQPLAQHGKDVADNVAASVQGGVRSAQKVVDEATDTVSAKVDEVKSNASPMLDKVIDQAQKLLRHGGEVLNDTSRTVREKATQASDVAVGYTKDEPMKALLIAAATGALLMGLVTVMSRPRD